MKKYTKAQIDYLREIAPGRYNDEITELFNKKFGTNATKTVIQSLKASRGIKSGVVKAKRQYTLEQLSYLQELSKKGLSNAEITLLFNERFGTNRTETAIQLQRVQYGFQTTARNCFKKGHVPWNKGLKGVNFGGQKTQFKPGHKPHNWVPVGSERVNADGYMEVKIQDGKLQKNWKGKHVLIWEQHNSQPVPPGHAVIFGDGNRRNFDPENLILVSRAQLARMNQSGLIKNDANLTKTGVIIADLLNKIGERKKQKAEVRR
jgi:hypothetical protein